MNTDLERLAMLQRTWKRYLMASSHVERLIAGMLLARVAKRHMGWLVDVGIDHYHSRKESDHGRVV